MYFNLMQKLFQLEKNRWDLPFNMPLNGKFEEIPGIVVPDGFGGMMFLLYFSLEILTKW